MSVETKRSDTHQELFATIKVDGQLSSHASIFLREEEPGRWFYQVAFCSKKDQFSRDHGRKLARRRYFQERNSPYGSLLAAPEFRPMKFAIDTVHKIAP